MRAVHAEFRKLFTTKTGFLLTLVSVVLSGLLTVLVSLNVSKTDSASDALQTIITIGSNFGYLLSAILGIIGITGEYRHQTVTPTFLSVPVRSTVVIAKLFTYLVWGAVLGLLNLIIGLVIALPLLSNRLVDDVSLSASGVRTSMWAAIVITAIFGIIGVGLGALLRNQVAAIVGLVLYLFIVENVLGAISAVQSVYKYLPGALASALTGSVGTPDNIHLLGRTPAALLLIAYGLVFAAVGAAITISRDVT
ncbi:MAG TPA: ABC transporter permease [Mycobacteriales bacterium]|jgi:hypothetical protein|nr:ABC transporter permease [Mycobacteriales bacterium]